jgi:hypothetical protein
MYTPNDTALSVRELHVPGCGSVVVEETIVEGEFRIRFDRRVLELFKKMEEEAGKGDFHIDVSR